MKKHRNIPIFVPHLGCPNTCVFCNQRKISGCEKADFSSVSKEIEEALDTIPEDASVTATTFYTTNLSQREILYDIRYCSMEHVLETEYVVLKLSSYSDYKNYATDGKDNGYENLVWILEEHGYERYRSLEDVLEIYRKVKY